MCLLTMQATVVRRIKVEKAMDRVAWALTASLEMPDYLGKLQQQWAVLFEALHIAERELGVAAGAISTSSSGGGSNGQALGSSSSSSSNGGKAAVQSSSSGKASGSAQNQQEQQQQGKEAGGKLLLGPVLSQLQLSKQIRQHMQEALVLLGQQQGTAAGGGAAEEGSIDSMSHPLLVWLDVVLRALMLRVYAESTR